MRTRQVGFRGRSSELDQLTAALRGAAAGVPFVITIEGEAGIGKSRLVEEATASATDLRVLRGKASELEHDRPFGPVLDALEIRSRELPSTNNAGDFAAADALLDAIDRASAEGPIVLVLEDVHWADVATLALLARVALQRGALNTSLLCTRRPSPRSAKLDALLRSLTDEGGIELGLGPLPEDAIDELVADLAGARPGPTLSTRVRGASGNPLYVIEFVDGLDHELIHQHGTADVADASAPPPLPLTIMHRLGLLPADTIELLRIAAILGASFALDELVAVARRPALELLPILQPAIDSGVVTATNDGFRFRHDLIHEAAYADIPESIRRVLHADAAAALAAEATPDVMHVARHFELARKGPDADASDWLWRAAETAVLLDRELSVEFIARSVARTPDDHPELLNRRALWAIEEAKLPGRERLARAEAMLREPLPDVYRWAIEESLVNGLALVGDLDAAEQLALATSRPRAAQAVMALGIVIARCLRGEPERAARVVADLLAAVGGDANDDAILAGHYARDAAHAAEFIDLLQTVSDALVAWARGENEAGLAIARRWEELAPVLSIPPQSLDLAMLLFSGESGAAMWRDSVRRIASVAHVFPEIDMGAGFAYWSAGEWDDALAQFETAVARAAESGPRCSDALFALAALIEAERNNAEAAEQWIARSRAFPSASGLETWVEAVAAEVAGDLDRARTLLTDAWRRDERAGVRVWQRLYAADLVRHARSSGDGALVGEVLSVVESLVPRGGDIALAVATHCRALRDGDGNALVEVGDLYRRVGRPVDAARADEDAAAFLATSQTVRAQQLVDRASAVYEGLGAQRDLARLARRARTARMERRPPSAPRPLTGWPSLTESEMRVAELVSHGLTYRVIGERLYVSRRTVETHVAHIFAKLDVRSKAELASAYVARFGA